MNPPVNPERVAGASNDWTGAVIRFSSHAKVTNEILFFKVMRKRETKFKSVFQSNAKTKNKKRNSYPFFKVMRKRKTKTEIDIRFSK